MSIGTAADAAERILTDVWAGRIIGHRAIPVDPIRISALMGIDVFDADLEPGVSGALVKNPGEDPTILLNKNDHANRRRFTVAHELGHYVANSADGDDYEYVDYRDGLAKTGGDPAEVFANQFAANLLMPESDVRSLNKQGLSVAEVAYKFQVSDDAMRYRFENLNLTNN